LMTELSVATKMIAMPVILSRLKEAGRLAMDDFLRNHKHTIGKSSSFDLAEMFD
ncbi:MAG: patatin-like phospholipase family protein, partial [Marivivens sp.]|nr:patatin-like phospholipase family protein [Marivivens sp.]